MPAHQRHIAWLGAALLVAAPHVASANAPSSADLVQTQRGLRVYNKPAKASRYERGFVMKDARFSVLERKRGKGCRGDWLRIADRSWICGAHTKKTTKPPGNPGWVQHTMSAPLAGSYVIVKTADSYKTLADAAAGKHSIKMRGLGAYKYGGAKSAGGVRYLKVDGRWVPRSQARIVSSIDFKGVALEAGDRQKRLAFVGPRKAHVYDERGSLMKGVEALPRQIYIGEIGPGQRGAGGVVIHSIGDSRYVRAQDISRLTFTARPQGVKADERWVDVDLTQQTLVAYVGDQPVFATLVSTANRATPTGAFRIEKKRPFARMKNRPSSRVKWDTYSPWVLSIRGRIAMHAAYWHTDYGKARSHGCVNLSPRDAKWIYDWTYPALPPGWLRLETDAHDRASLVRIRRSPK